MIPLNNKVQILLAQVIQTQLIQLVQRILHGMILAHKKLRFDRIRYNAFFIILVELIDFY
jgi:hypothetical protein